MSDSKLGKFGNWILQFVFITILLVAILSIAAMTMNATLRYQVGRFVTEVPGYTIGFFVRQRLNDNRNFVGAAGFLDKLYDLSVLTSEKRSGVFPSVLDNTRYVMNAAQMRADYAAMLPFIERLAKDYPDLFEPQMWRTLIYAQVSPEKTFEAAERTLNLAEVDSRPYRAAIQAALQLGAYDQAAGWCAKYKIAQHGSLENLDRTSVLYNVGLSRIALEPVANDDKWELIVHESVRLDVSTHYSFLLKNLMRVSSVRLHVGFVPGTKIQFEEITAFSGTEKRSVPVEQFFISPSNGFMVDSQTVITTADRGEIISIQPKDNDFGVVDRIDLSLQISRAALAAPGLCEVQP